MRHSTETILQDVCLSSHRKPQSIHKLVQYPNRILHVDFTIESMGLVVPYLECELGFFVKDGLLGPFLRHIVELEGNKGLFVTGQSIPCFVLVFFVVSFCVVFFGFLCCHGVDKRGGGTFHLRVGPLLTQHRRGRGGTFHLCVGRPC